MKEEYKEIILDCLKKKLNDSFGDCDKYETSIYYMHDTLSIGEQMFLMTEVDYYDNVKFWSDVRGNEYCDYDDYSVRLELTKHLDNYTDACDYANDLSYHIKHNDLIKCSSNYIISSFLATKTDEYIPLHVQLRLLQYVNCELDGYNEMRYENSPLWFILSDMTGIYFNNEMINYINEKYDVNSNITSSEEDVTDLTFISGISFDFSKLRPSGPSLRDNSNSDDLELVSDDLESSMNSFKGIC